MVVERSPLRKLPNISLDLFPFYQLERIFSWRFAAVHTDIMTLKSLMSGRS